MVYGNKKEKISKAKDMVAYNATTHEVTCHRVCLGGDFVVLPLVGRVSLSILPTPLADVSDWSVFSRLPSCAFSRHAH